MLKVNTYTIKGTKTGLLTLPKEFDQKANPKLLAQALYVYEERSHVGLRQAKTRSEVNRTGKKLYKQKGTGGARHGSRRANLFVGGGVAFGPRPVRRILNLSESLRKKAKLIAFKAKVDEKEVVAVSGLAKLAKTKAAADLVKKLSGGKDMRLTFVLADTSRSAARYFRNLVKVEHVFYKDINALDIARGGTIVLDKDIFAK